VPTFTATVPAEFALPAAAPGDEPDPDDEHAVKAPVASATTRAPP
jgi:hypothetical protein